ncbi:GAF domain-containing sensor histidine kinase [Candidatus Saccharibacteria bacterium]|nr:GAF domain-containing sensor histidine kinase [Candidatus Saccharibacteria bacterium]
MIQLMLVIVLEACFLWAGFWLLSKNRILAGILAFVSAGIISGLLVPGAIDDYYVWFGLTSAMILTIIISIDVAKNSMFDIKSAAIRTLAYILSLSSLFVIYYLVATIVTNLLFSHNNLADQSTISMLIAFGLLVIFEPMKRFFDRITKTVFYHDDYSVDDFIARLSRKLATTTDLRSLIERISNEIAQSLKSEQVFLFIETPDGGYILAGTSGHEKMHRQDADFISSLTTNNHQVIARSLLRNSDPVAKLMKSYRLQLVLPLKQNKISGCLCVGERLTSKYTMRDMRILSAIADELLIAIQNSLSIQEIKGINATLEQRISNATKELRHSNRRLTELDEAKDEFMSMASHQLRTPLTSIKGYISMIMEGDAGQVTAQQKKFLEEAFNSSERMVRLIGDFLNVSRLQTGKFVIEKRPVDLSVIVAQEIESLKPNAEARHMKLVYDKPDNFPILNVDEDKMRQVIMNFSDNAIYYSHDDSAIFIDLKVDGDEVVFTVKDNGIGVPNSEKEHLFSKFFRATNARKHRPDGTGVGLFLARKVVNAHGGQIIFKSQEGKGSTFGFRLPIDN